MKNTDNTGPSGSIGLLEKTFCRRPPCLAPPAGRREDAASRPLRDGDTIAVVGGGLAGPLFARHLLRLTHQSGPRVRVVLFDRTSCNYCAGLMTALARNTLSSVYGLGVPSEVILTEIDGCVFVNDSGSVEVEVPLPLVSMLRTDRFGEAGFDESLKYRLLAGMEDLSDRLEIVEPVTINEVRVPAKGAPGWVAYRQRGERQVLSVDFLVMAAGLRSLERPMLRDFIAQTGFVPPPTMLASVTELNAANAKYNRLTSRAVILDNILPNTMAAIIPKRPNWITVSSLHRHLSRDDLEALFAHPRVKEWIDLPNPTACLRCRIVCPAQVFTAPARRLAGDGWLVLGDLTGYGRALKDGYFACMLGSALAAEALFWHGGTGRALTRHYAKALARAFPAGDNRIGMGLFHFNERLSATSWFPSLFLEAARAEAEKNPYGSLLHMGLRTLFTGEVSYRVATPIFAAGLVKYYATRPLSLLKHLTGRAHPNS